MLQQESSSRIEVQQCGRKDAKSRKEAEELADVRAIVEQAGWAVYKTKTQRQAEKKSARRVPGQD